VTSLSLVRIRKAGPYDECIDTREHAEAVKRIRKVRKPTKDPVYGTGGPLTRLWRARSYFCLGQLLLSGGSNVRAARDRQS